MTAPLTRLTDPWLLLLIARRGALEALSDRMTLLLSLFFAVAFPSFMVLIVLRPLFRTASPASSAGLATYFLVIGLMPTTSAVGIASGQFAGEKEQGNLTPLLASPASNIAIFGGKVLGSIIPGILFSVVAECIYVIELVMTTGIGTLQQLPGGLSLAMLALVPITALFAATVASLISSRVHTFSAAQQLSGLVLLPLWAALFGLAAKIQAWGIVPLAVLVVALLVCDVVLVVLAASTWRREEVLAAVP